MHEALRIQLDSAQRSLFGLGQRNRLENISDANPLKPPNVQSARNQPYFLLRRPDNPDNTFALQTRRPPDLATLDQLNCLDSQSQPACF